MPKSAARRRRNRDYRREYLMYQGTTEQKKKRALRNKARRAMIKAGKARKGDGKDVDHKKALASGGTSSSSNLRVISRKLNRSRNSHNGGRPKGGRKRLPSSTKGAKNKRG